MNISGTLPSYSCIDADRPESPLQSTLKEALATAEADGWHRPTNDMWWRVSEIPSTGPSQEQQTAKRHSLVLPPGRPSPTLQPVQCSTPPAEAVPQQNPFFTPARLAPKQVLYAPIPVIASGLVFQRDHQRPPVTTPILKPSVLHPFSTGLAFLHQSNIQQPPTQPLLQRNQSVFTAPVAQHPSPLYQNHTLPLPKSKQQDDPYFNQHQYIATATLPPRIPPRGAQMENLLRPGHHQPSPLRPSHTFHLPGQRHHQPSPLRQSYTLPLSESEQQAGPYFHQHQYIAPATLPPQIPPRGAQTKNIPAPQAVGNPADESHKYPDWDWLVRRMGRPENIK